MKRIIIVFVVVFSVLVLTSHFLFNTRKNREFYVGMYNDNRNDFIFFSGLSKTFFEKNKANSYTAIFTARRQLWQVCSSKATNIDSSCNSNFFNANEIEKAKKFMRKASLHVIIYYQDSTSFIFDGGRVEINYYRGSLDGKYGKGKDIIDSNFVLCKVP